MRQYFNIVTRMKRPLPICLFLYYHLSSTSITPVLIVHYVGACEEENIQYQGFDINGGTFPSEVTSWQECSDYCRSITTCNAWTFGTSGDRPCRLISYVKGRQAKNTWISGSRFCGGRSKYSILCYTCF